MAETTVEEIRKRHEDADDSIEYGRGDDGQTWDERNAMAAHRDRATLLSIIDAGAKSEGETPTRGIVASLETENAQHINAIQCLTQERDAALARIEVLKVVLFDLCQKGRVAAECVDTTHGAGWNQCITWMESGLYAAMKNDLEMFTPASPSKPPAPDGVTPSREQISKILLTAYDHWEAAGEILALVSTPRPPGPGAWRPIETAPRDGTLVDLWCVSPDNEDATAIRLTDCAWHNADAIFPHTGWTRVTDDGNWDLVESRPTSPLGLPAWKPTHFMLPPAPPSSSGEATMGEE